MEWNCVVIVTGPLSELQIAYVCRETLQVISLLNSGLKGHFNVLNFTWTHDWFPSQGLGYLHTKGKMHRDIKVSFLFCCFSGRAYSYVPHTDTLSHIKSFSNKSQNIKEQEKKRNAKCKIGKMRPQLHSRKTVNVTINASLDVTSLWRSSSSSSSSSSSAAEVWTEVTGKEYLTRKHVTNGVTYSGFEVELKLITPCARTRTGASVSCVITEGQGWTYYLYSASTQQALPVSSTLTAGCHQRDCQSQPTATLSVELSESCETGNCSFDQYQRSS